MSLLKTDIFRLGARNPAVSKCSCLRNILQTEKGLTGKRYNSMLKERKGKRKRERERERRKRAGKTIKDDN